MCPPCIFCTITHTSSEKSRRRALVYIGLGHVAHNVLYVHTTEVFPGHVSVHMDMMHVCNGARPGRVLVVRCYARYYWLQYVPREVGRPNKVRNYANRSPQSLPSLHDRCQSRRERTKKGRSTRSESLKARWQKERFRGLRDVIFEPPEKYL